MPALFMLVALLAALTPVPAPSQGGPALWMVTSPTAKAYLFGTIHFAKDEPWITDAITNAFHDSSELWLEIADPTDAAAALPLVQQLGLDPSHPLSTKLPKDDITRIDAALKEDGLPSGEAAFEIFRPWIVAVTLDALPFMKAGYNAKSGIDAQLRVKAQQDLKPVNGLETIEQQMHFFSDMSDDQQRLLLESTLASIEKGHASTEDLWSAWRSGDLDRIIRDSTSAPTPAQKVFLETLLYRRNAAWAETIDKQLHGQGTRFIAVGAAHLAGPGSLIELLQKRGYTVTRIQ